MTFDELLAEGSAVPVEGWDFSWFDGRATEERPPWRYSGLLAGQMAAASSSLDLHTGGGEVLAGVAAMPPRAVALEAWQPNLPVARRNLGPRGVAVVGGAHTGLPFRAEAFDLVTTRHPTVVPWAEVARVLVPGGRYLAQHVGIGSNRELYEFLMGPQRHDPRPNPERIAAEAGAAGLVVDEAREAWIRLEFFDVAAVVHFLRKVVWTVPDFTVERYRDRLAALHERIGAEGRFVAHASRVLVRAHRP
ncbi:class I SAM-dependent methyltransferase [Amycolatopsis suaedae]|uniref:Class I SAM-dependent methyltransferase n=1 Tax=Amycolatopsis suaedae TaxID=2510978 RepID=A0A4Q7J063_9PSEU|nr:class I SAM-dependent methyltransferase [Amycolatopsis suaedae]RZQ59753.1 class I SAM-dependent methyltransferase [Amycolatopsis suaedae]